jgi:thiol-disulfide isomerase/thioredoxin
MSQIALDGRGQSKEDHGMHVRLLIAAWFFLVPACGSSEEPSTETSAVVEDGALAGAMRRKKPAAPPPSSSLLKGTSLTVETLGNISVGSALPAFSRPALNGQKASLARLLHPPRESPSEAVVISFFTTYCLPCRETLPITQRVLQDNKDTPVRGLFVAVREQSPRVAPWLQKMNLSVQTVADSGGFLEKTFGIEFVKEGENGETLPKTIVTDGEGVVSTIFDHEGADFETQLRAAIRRASAVD